MYVHCRHILQNGNRELDTKSAFTKFILVNHTLHAIKIKFGHCLVLKSHMNVTMSSMSHSLVRDDSVLEELFSSSFTLLSI